MIFLINISIALNIWKPIYGTTQSQKNQIYQINDFISAYEIFTTKRNDENLLRFVAYGHNPLYGIRYTIIYFISTFFTTSN